MTLLEANQLIVNQKAKITELTNQYLVRDAEGNDLGRVEQEGQSKLRKVLRFATKVDQFLTTQLSIYDASGAKVLGLVRPGKVFKSRVVVTDASGGPVGEIVQQNVFGKIKFDLVGAQGEKLGAIKAENWRAWNFSIVDGSDREVARITKKFVGIVKAAFTTADNYIVDIEPSLGGNLRLLTVAAACAVDTALKQDDRSII
jgi:uncharacterized protein YxjI